MLRPLKRIFLAGLAFSALSGFSAEPLEKDISGIWEKPGYYCTDPTTSNRVHWGWGHYRLKQTGTKLAGTYQNENYPFEYRVTGSILSNEVILETRRLDSVVDERGRTNAWVYRGKVESNGNTIAVGTSKFRWFNLKRFDKTQVARGK